MGESTNTTVIIGSTGGFGREFVKLCAEDGRDLILIGRDEEKLRRQAETIEREYGVKVKTGRVDLTDETYIEDVERVIEESGLEPDAFIYTAGMGGNDGDLSTEDIRRMEHINITVPKELTERFVERFYRRQIEGRIMVTTGTAALAAVNPGNQSEYVRTRKMLREHLSAKQSAYRKKGVSVTNFMPPLTRTDFQDDVGRDKLYMRGLRRPAEVAKLGYKGMQKRDSSVIADPNVVARITWALQGGLSGIRSSRNYREPSRFRRGIEDVASGVVERMPSEIRSEIEEFMITGHKIMTGTYTPLLRVIVRETTREEEDRLVEALNSGSTLSVIKEVLEIGIERRERAQAEIVEGLSEHEEQKDESDRTFNAADLRRQKRILRVYNGVKSIAGEDEELYNAIVERRTFDKNGLNKFGQSRIEVRIMENLMMVARMIYQQDLTFEELEPIVRKAIQTKNFNEIYREITEKRGIYYTETEVIEDPSRTSGISIAERAKRIADGDDFLGGYSEEIVKLLAISNAQEDGRRMASENDVAEVERIIKLISNERKQVAEPTAEPTKTPGEKRTISDAEIGELARARKQREILTTMLRAVEFLEDRFRGKGDRDEH